MSATLTLGVVGHVDHGKTALVKALTGIETDRLKEERERGLSIVLGFAFVETRNGVVDLIDVPGHEDFVRAMISGATALDGIVLCVAANESVMPQTVEHFNIARLLGVQTGFVVVTKTDLVDEETLAIVKEEIQDFVRGTFLEHAPVIEASAVSGAGIDAVREHLDLAAANTVDRDQGDQFFLPLDRVFTMRGFGVVATGTLRGGELAVGDAVEIYPAGRPSTVRALQNHNQAIERASPGQRVAVNLRGVDRDELKRGDVLATPASLSPTRRVDTELKLLDDASTPVKNNARLRFLTGTTEAVAKLRILDRRELAPGDTAIVQLYLDREIATRPSEHFLVRSVSPMHTIGGGRILNVNAARHRRFDAAVTERLKTVATGDIERIVRHRLLEAGGQGIDPAGLADELGVSRDEFEAAVRATGVIAIGKERVVESRAYAELLAEIVNQIERFHERQAFKTGIDAGSLITELQNRAGPEVVRAALKQLVGDAKIEIRQELYALAGYDPFANLGAGEKQLVVEIEQAFLSCGLEPPSPKTLVSTEKPRQAVYRLLLESGRLIRLRTYKTESSLVLHSTVLAKAKRAIEQEFPYPRPFALKDIRDLLGSSRKYVVPLMEHLDATGATTRSGDLRRLREQ